MTIKQHNGLQALIVKFAFSGVIVAVLLLYSPLTSRLSPLLDTAATL